MARERAVGAREKAILSREHVIRSEEVASDEREDAAFSREEALRLMEDLVKARERAAAAAARRHLLSDLRAANERLTLMAIRSQELAEEAEDARRKLEMSERELRSGMEFRERLIGIVSHDLRNPLGAISMSVNMLLRYHHLDDKGRQLASRIGGSTERMREMIVQLLDFTRTHTGAGIPVKPEATNLEKVCRQVIEELEIRHSMMGRFRYEFHGDLNGTWDADRLGQVVSNLGGNAVQYGRPDAPISIRVSDDGEEVLLEIHNQGEPIPPEMMPFIFDPFRRAREEGGSKGGGLGLGLHISYEIVRGHGGSIAVRSTTTEGTTFSVRLPRHRTEARPAEEDPRPQLN